MFAGHARLARRAFWVVGTALLLTALAVALPLDGGQLLHSHGGSGVATFYNASCPLAAVAACHSVGLLVATASPALALVPAGAATLASGARLFAPAARHTDPRAPPLV
jgi:hypothetical protein